MRRGLIVAFLLLLFPQLTYASDNKSSRTLFGVASHFLHTRQIYTDKDDTWLLPRTMPLQTELGTPWVTEQIYALTSKSRALVDDGTANAADKARISDRRKLIDNWLDIYDKAGTKVVLTVSAADPRAKKSDVINEAFGNWITDLISRHPGIKAVQLHNEPNLRSFWTGSPEDYVNLYRGIAHKIKAKNPEVAITVGAISSLSWQPGRKWLKSAIKAGLLEFADGVSIHPYNLKIPPETDPHAKIPLRDAIINFWEEMSAAAPAGKNLKLYFTELGYSSAPNGIAGIGSEDLQANYLARLMMIYTDLRVRDGVPIEAVFWYDLKNDGSDPTKQEHNFGLVSSDLKRKKPAFQTYRRIITAIPDPLSLKPSATVYTADSADAVITSWTNVDGDDVIAVWRTGEGTKSVRVDAKSSSNSTLVKANSLDVNSGAEAEPVVTRDDGSFHFTLADVEGVQIIKFAKK